MAWLPATFTGEAPIHWASLEGHLSTVHLLLEHRANLEASDDRGRTAIHKCVLKGHLQLLDYLRFKGLDLTIQDRDGRTPAHWTAYMGQIVCLDYLLLHAPRTVLETQGPRFWISAPCPGTLKVHFPIPYFFGGLFVCSFACLLGADHEGCLPLHWAAKQGHTACVSLILDKAPDSVWVRDSLGLLVRSDAFTDGMKDVVGDRSSFPASLLIG